MITKLKFKLELFSVYFKRNILYLFLGIAFGSFIFTFQNQILSFVSNPRFHKKYIGIEGLYTSNKLPTPVSQLTTYSLVTFTENLKPIPSELVKSIQSTDNLTYKFFLKDNYTWHDGKKFTAHDINFIIPGLTFRPINDFEIDISTETGFAPILSLLQKPLFRKKTFGLGPYAIKNISYQDGYISEIYLQPVQGHLPTIIYRFYPNEKSLFTAFKLGEVDEVQANSLPDDIKNWPKIRINPHVQTSQRYLAVFLNTQKLPDKPFRQALAYATPKTTDKNLRCFGPISQVSWAYNPSIKEYSYSPSRAKELFDQAEVKIQNIKFFVNDRNYLPIAENIKKSWKEILNLDTSITVETQANPDDFDAILTFGEIPPDPDQYLFWHSTQTATNRTKINNSRIDKLLEEGRLTFDPQERKKIYQEFQKFLLEESPAIFLEYPATYDISRIK